MTTEKLKAYQNHGRWIVGCPDCNGAELVDPKRPDAVVICQSCYTLNNTFDAHRATLQMDRAVQMGQMTGAARNEAVRAIKASSDEVIDKERERAKTDGKVWAVSFPKHWEDIIKELNDVTDDLSYLKGRINGKEL